MKTRPETLAVRAVAEWRRYDVIAHLGLRYYLDSPCALRDRWAVEIATRQVSGTRGTCYHETFHFKEDKGNGEISHRRICIPAPDEILAEAALLEECARSGRPFRSADCVYSYRLPHHGDTRGVFVPYFDGYLDRHRAISNACRRQPKGFVEYTDIRRFYPSITTKVAKRAWTQCARRGHLARWALSLGCDLIDKHASAGKPHQEDLLTGPMFTHLLANLVLRGVDKEMEAAIPGGYFRYVDDIVFVGNAVTVRDAKGKLAGLLEKLGLLENSQKNFAVSAAQWLLGEDDFQEDPGSASWRGFVGGMRQLVALKPARVEDLRDQLRQAGFRIVPLDYSSAIGERRYLSRLRRVMSSFRNIRRSIRERTVGEIVGMGRQLRSRYEGLFQAAVENARNVSGYDRKRCIHKLRCYASRLAYLAEPGQLNAMTQALGGVPEMALYGAVYEALATGDVTRLISYGVNAPQAAAQPLKAVGRSLICRCRKWTKPALQGRAVLLAHGLSVSDEGTPALPYDAMTAFCSRPDRDGDLATEHRSFFGRLACIQGSAAANSHATVLRTAFDADEDLVFELDYLMRESS